jgi:hypothetical protein
MILLVSFVILSFVSPSARVRHRHRPRRTWRARSRTTTTNIHCAFPSRNENREHSSACTSAFLVNSTADVAKLETATTRHVIAAFILLHPELAFWALLVFGSPNELDELLIVLIEDPADRELLAGHSLVVLHLTLQTVDFGAQWAGELGVCLIKVEYVLTACRWAP